MQAIPQPYWQVSFVRDEKEIARFHFDPSLNRPFVFPIIGPSGRPLTLMGHPGDPHGHGHHDSVWISLDKVNGIGFWSDHGRGDRGRIVHQRVERIEDGDDRAFVITRAAWTAPTGHPVLNERR